MKGLRFIICISLFALFFVQPLFAQNPHPQDAHPEINFQGRIEQDEIGYDGEGYFGLTISNSATFGVQSIWTSFAEVSCVQGIYNVLIGSDTDDTLPDTLFNTIDNYYLHVEFGTEGAWWSAPPKDHEGLSPPQKITSVAFAVNADRLDGLESPESAFVGVTDVQTIENKILGANTTTSYFIVTPAAAAPPGTTEGAFWYDSATNTMNYYNGTAWVNLSSSGGGGSGNGTVTGDGASTYVAWWNGQSEIDGEAAFTWDSANDKLTVDSGATTGNAVEIDANLLTTGSALSVTSTQDDNAASYDLVHFSAQTGRALFIEHTGAKGAEGSTVTISRLNNGRGLTVEAAITTQNAVFIRDLDSFTSGNLLSLSSSSDSSTAGAALLYANCGSSYGSAKAINVLQRGAGEGLYISKTGTSAVGMSVRINQQTDSGDGTVNSTEGGALHIYNYQPQQALTIYGNTGINPDQPLVKLDSGGGTAFDQPVLDIESALGSDAPPLYLHPLSDPPDSVEGGPQLGMIYVKKNTTAGSYSLNHYNGFGWQELSARWNYQSFVRLSDSTFAITNNAYNNAIFNAGVPIRYAQTVGTWNYGVIVARSSGTVTLDGAPMDGTHSTYLQTGRPEMLRQVNFFEPGSLSVGDDFSAPNAWQMTSSYVVRATAKLDTAAAGADAHISIGIGGAGNDLLNSPLYITLPDGSDAQVDSGININPSNYNITFGGKFFINVDQIGSGTAGSDLLVTLEVITP